LVEKEHAYIKSNAILKISSKLGGFYPLFSIFWIVPGVIRDKIYDLIAKKRYKWFGRREQCIIPTPKLKDRFLN
jgi:predicted DCC family thiol-disulfide oxidoreductase YuxK